MCYMKKVPKDTHQTELCVLAYAGEQWCYEKELRILFSFLNFTSLYLKKNCLMENEKKTWAKSKSIWISVVV